MEVEIDLDKAERDKKIPELSGMAKLIEDIKIREAVLEGARAYELEKLERENNQQYRICLIRLIEINLLYQGYPSYPKSNLPIQI